MRRKLDVVFEDCDYVADLGAEVGIYDDVLEPVAEADVCELSVVRQCRHDCNADRIAPFAHVHAPSLTANACSLPSHISPLGITKAGTEAYKTCRRHLPERWLGRGTIGHLRING